VVIDTIHSPASSVDDGNANNFTRLTRFQFTTSAGDTNTTDVWVLDTPAGDVGTKPTITAHVPTAISGVVLIVQEVSGLAPGTTTAACYDGTAGTASATTTTSPAPLPSYTSTASNEYLVNVLNDDFGGITTWSPPAGYAGNDTVQSGNGTGGVAWKNSTNGTETGQWSWTGGGTDDVGTVLVAFKLVVTTVAAGTGAMAFAGTATAVVAVVAAGPGAMAFAGSANATLSGPSGTGALVFTGSGTATHTVAARGNGDLSFAGAAVATFTGAVAVVPNSAAMAYRNSLGTSESPNHWTMSTATEEWGTIIVAFKLAPPLVGSTLVFGGSGTATLGTPNTGTGALAFAGTGTARVAVGSAGSGSMVFAGSGTAIAPTAVIGTGAMVFAGSGLVVVVPLVAGTGALVFDGRLTVPGFEVAVWAGVNQPRWESFTHRSRWDVYAVAESRWVIETPSPAVSRWQIGVPVVSMIASASLEYIRIPVSVTIAGIPYNPTADSVQMAFTSTMREPVFGDWNQGSWETTGAGSFYALCLIGPGGSVVLTAGTWFVWVKIADTPEIPVKAAGSITIFP
jgi:hypothetical protein